MFPQKAVHPKSGDSRLTVEDSLKFGIALDNLAIIGILQLLLLDVLPEEAHHFAPAEDARASTDVAQRL